MGDVVNLRKARKKKARVEKERRAEKKRTAFGLTKAQKTLTRTLKDKAARDIDAHRRSGGDDDSAA